MGGGGDLPGKGLRHSQRDGYHDTSLPPVGGAGEGPGELTDPCCLAFGPDGLLWVRESVRYSAFELGPESARYERGLRIAHTGVGMVAPVTFDALGRLVDIGPIYSSPSGLRMVRLHRNPDGAVDTVGMANPERLAAGSTTVTELVMLGTTRDELDIRRVARVRFQRIY